jgi:sirohydrochlorin ferrochelatase
MADDRIELFVGLIETIDVQGAAEACRRLTDRYPQVQFCLAEPLGRHPLLVEVLEKRARSAEGN